VSVFIQSYIVAESMADYLNGKTICEWHVRYLPELDDPVRFPSYLIKVCVTTPSGDEFIQSVSCDCDAIDSPFS
jgi:hypothetical protein